MAPISTDRTIPEVADIVYVSVPAGYNNDYHSNVYVDFLEQARYLRVSEQDSEASAKTTLTDGRFTSQSFHNPGTVIDLLCLSSKPLRWASPRNCGTLVSHRSGRLKGYCLSELDSCGLNSSLLLSVGFIVMLRRREMSTGHRSPCMENAGGNFPASSPPARWGSVGLVWAFNLTAVHFASTRED